VKNDSHKGALIPREIPRADTANRGIKNDLAVSKVNKINALDTARIGYREKTFSRYKKSIISIGASRENIAPKGGYPLLAVSPLGSPNLAKRSPVVITEKNKRGSNVTPTVF
jgi:hypothetical protein